MKGCQRIVRRALGSLALAAAVAVLEAGCSEIGFPAVHDMPAPRADTTLTPDEVKQATDNLLCERDHLATEAQASATQANGQPSAPGKPPAPSAVQKPCAPPAAAATTQPASAYAKP